MNFVGIEKVSLLDYDEKISCVLFCNGCNFLCPYCHNYKLALGKIKTFIDFNEILHYLKQRKNVLDAVVISGGEPTLYKDLKDVIKQIKELGYLVKLDTNGTNFEIVKELIEEKLIDYLAMDIKSDLDGYSLVAGVSNINYENIKKTINYLINSDFDYEFRTTLVKQYNNLESIINIGILCRGAKRFYLQKFVLAETCFDKSLKEIKKEDALEYLNVLKKYVNNVELRGY